MTVSRFVLLALALAAVGLGAAACGDATGTLQAEQHPDFIVVTDDASLLSAATLIGMSDACSALDWKCSVYGPTSYSPTDAIDRFAEAVEINPKAIILVVKDPPQPESLAQILTEHDISVSIIARPTYYQSLSSAIPAAEGSEGYVSQDQFAAGYQNGLQAALWARDVTERAEGTILIPSCCPDDPVYAERVKGTIAGIEDSSSYLPEPIEVSYGSAANMLTVLTERYEARPNDVVAIADVGFLSDTIVEFSESESFSKDAALGIFGFHSLAEDRIKDGTIQWAVVWDPYEQGFDTVMDAWSLAETGHYPSSEESGPAILSSSTIGISDLASQDWEEIAALRGLEIGGEIDDLADIAAQEDPDNGSTLGGVVATVVLGTLLGAGLTWLGSIILRSTLDSRRQRRNGNSEG